MKRFLLIFFLLLLTGCHSARDGLLPEAHKAAYPETQEALQPSHNTAESSLIDPIEALIASMSLEERVGQLFLARCDASTAAEDVQKYHLGGYVLFAVDFESETPESMVRKIASYQAVARIPLLIAVDEEGGSVTRVSRNRAFRPKPFPSPRFLFENQGYEAVLEAEYEKCLLLASLGINVNLGPVCDIVTEPNAFMYDRSLGQNPSTTSRFVADTVSIMAENRIGSTLKHFPGYGNNTDTHTGIAIDGRPLQQLTEQDLIPFQAGIQAGCDAILISHTIVEAWDPELPASLSAPAHQYLRNSMQFEGVILTDDLIMEAITDRYGAGEAAVMAVLAGNDLLCSSEYAVQYEAVLAAVLDGRIHLRILNAAVRNVLEWKAELGLLS